MQIVNLMANDVWSEADILNRTEAMVRSEFSVAAETILNRKLQGAAMGLALSQEDQAEVMRFQGVLFAAQTAGAQARADMALLDQAMAVEAAQARLDLPLYVGPLTVLNEEGVEVAHPDAGRDAAERAAAADTLAAATLGVWDLVARRNPIPQPEEAQP